MWVEIFSEFSQFQSFEMSIFINHECKLKVLIICKINQHINDLKFQDSRFWPARLNSTQLPDVYGVVTDTQRGHRPTILPRDDILKETVLEVLFGSFSSVILFLNMSLCLYVFSSPLILLIGRLFLTFR